MPLNVIYLVSHDTGRFLGCYGRPLGVTPNLDRFAADNVRFARAYCSAPCCGPSRCCVMTGKYSRRTGTLGLGGMGWDLPDAERTIVDDFNDAGYTTVHMGFCHERRYGEMRYQVDGKRHVDDERYWKCSAHLVVDNALDWLQREGRKRPFYMNLGIGETHVGHLGVRDYGPQVPPQDVWLPPVVPDTAATRDFFGRWYAEVRYFDQQVGRLLAGIEQLGFADDTLVVLTTDHGITTQRGKGHLYETGAEIFLLARLPGGARRSVVDHLIPNIDFRPTILDACGLPVPEGLDGRSFLPLLSGSDGYRPHERVFTERNYHGELITRGGDTYMDKFDPQRAVRTPDLHYIRHVRPQARSRPWYRAELTDLIPLGPHTFPSAMPIEDQPRPTEELYDLRHDPWEQDNLADRPEYQAQKRALAADLDRWNRETDDPALKYELPPPLCEPRWPTKDRPVHAVVRG
jgi:arylsulfatase A-like enzyme